MELVIFPPEVPVTCLHSATFLLGIQLDPLFQESCCAVFAQSVLFVRVFSVSWQLFIFCVQNKYF